MSWRIGEKTAVFMILYFTDDLEIFEDEEGDNIEQDGKEMTDKDLSEQTSRLFECRKSLRARK